MPEEWLGIVVEKEKVTWVRARIPDDAGGPIEILGDETLSLQQGPREQAYPVMHTTLSGLAEGVNPCSGKGQRGGAARGDTGSASDGGIARRRNLRLREQDGHRLYQKILDQQDVR